MIFGGTLRDKDVEHVVTVGCDRRFIFESCEEDSLKQAHPYFRTCVGRVEYQGLVEVRDTEHSLEGKKDERIPPKKETEVQKEKKQKMRENPRNVKLCNSFVHN